MRDLYVEQEKARYKLKLQHVIERVSILSLIIRVLLASSSTVCVCVCVLFTYFFVAFQEKLILSIEQEILRVHGRAARAMANQSIPLSVCAILRDEDIYNPIDPSAEDRDKNIRSRYNGRQFFSWLRDVDDKYEKIKVSRSIKCYTEFFLNTRMPHLCVCCVGLFHKYLPTDLLLNGIY